MKVSERKGTNTTDKGGKEKSVKEPHDKCKPLKGVGITMKSYVQTRGIGTLIKQEQQSSWQSRDAIRSRNH